MLTDNSFKPFSRMSTEAGGQAVVRAQPVRGSRRERSLSARLTCLTAVSLVPLRHRARGSGSIGNQCDCPGRDKRTTSGNLPDQDSTLEHVEHITMTVTLFDGRVQKGGEERRQDRPKSTMSWTNWCLTPDTYKYPLRAGGHYQQLLYPKYPDAPEAMESRDHFTW